MKIELKNGFTIAELLIALSIVGIAAALTLPSLSISIENRANGAALGRSVEAIESGCQALIQFANEKNSDGAIFTGHSKITKDDIGESGTTPIINDNGLFKNASQFFKVRNLASLSGYDAKAYDGGTASPALTAFAKGYAISPKLGAYYGVLKAKFPESGAEDPLIESIIIDVNGDKSPNRYGRDIFLFGLTDSCHMIPAGSDRLSSFLLLSKPLPNETAGCTKSVTNGLSCTSRVVKNGYKIDY